MSKVRTVLFLMLMVIVSAPVVQAWSWFGGEEQELSNLQRLVFVNKLPVEVKVDGRVLKSGESLFLETDERVLKELDNHFSHLDYGLLFLDTFCGALKVEFPKSMYSSVAVKRSSCLYKSFWGGSCKGTGKYPEFDGYLEFTLEEK